ncbi:MAG: hypothetical protein R2780_08350 [Crocinitomicaceae bacterium]
MNIFFSPIHFGCIFVIKDKNHPTELNIRLIILFLLIPSISEAQGPLFWDNDDIKIGVSARGKALAGQFFEDVLHMNLTAGGEIRFFNYHAFGVDFVFFRNRVEEESQDTITHEYYDNGWSDFDRRKYFLFDYRFYFNFIPKMNSVAVPYLNLLTKQGYRTMWYQKHNIFNRQVPYYHYSTFQEFGIALGCHFHNEGPFGADVSFGALRNYVQLNYEHDFLQGGESGFFGDISKPWKFHMRLNLFFNIFGK